MPPQLALAGPFSADLPAGTDMDVIKADLAGDHVAIVGDPDPAAEQQLAQVAALARGRGVPLSIVVIPGNPRHDSQLRDLATEVGKSEHGTVLVLSADWAGTYSDSVSRVRLEAGEDAAKKVPKDTQQRAVVSANDFVNAATAQPVPSPTVVTALLLALTVAATSGLYLVKARRARNAEGSALVAAG